MEELLETVLGVEQPLVETVLEVVVVFVLPGVEHPLEPEAVLGVEHPLWLITTVVLGVEHPLVETVLVVVFVLPGVEHPLEPEVVLGVEQPL